MLSIETNSIFPYNYPPDFLLTRKEMFTNLLTVKQIAQGRMPDLDHLALRLARSDVTPGRI